MTIVVIAEVVMGAETWTVAEAKAKFSELMDRARMSGPQTITKNGRRAAVLVSTEEWEKQTGRKGTLAEFFAASPFRESEVEFERLEDGPRDIDL
jgi:prevent-host-death family protein